MASEDEAKQKEKELLLGVGAKVQETKTDFSSSKLNEIDSILTIIENANFLQGCRISDNDFFQLRQKEIEEAKKKLFKLIK